MLLDCNRYVRMFRQTIDMDENQAQEWELVLREKGNATVRLPGHERRYNVPTGAGQSEIAGFMPGAEDDDNGPVVGRDIVVHYRVSRCRCITSPKYFLSVLLPHTSHTALFCPLLHRSLS
jgi:hypothetical protein